MVTEQRTQHRVALGRVHVYLGPSASAAEVRAARSSVGAVTLSGAGGLRVLRELKRDGDLYDVDFDPATYLEAPKKNTGLQSLPGVDGVNWVAAQEALGLPVIRTAATRIKAGDTRTLHASLSTPLRPRLSVVLVLDGEWLSGRHLPALLRNLAAKPRDITIILAHLFDPLSSPAAVQGLREVLAWGRDAGHRIELLRSDINALAAVTEGAAIGAIGLSTYTRHAPKPFSQKNKKDREKRETSPLVFVPALLHWHRALELGPLRPWNGAGICTCAGPGCASHPDGLLRFATGTSRVSSDVAAAVRAHDLHAWQGIVASVLAASDPAAELQQLRHAAITAAGHVASTYKVELPVPSWLSAWD